MWQGHPERGEQDGQRPGGGRPGEGQGEEALFTVLPKVRGKVRVGAGLLLLPPPQTHREGEGVAR